MSTSPFLPADDPRAGACGQCGAPMATDQRYCLSCGARRTHARLPFQDAVIPPAAVGPVAQVPGPAPALWSAPATSGPGTATLLAARAGVLSAFGVGVLVGDDGGGAQQPIVLGGAPAASAAAAPTTTEEAATSTTDTTAAEEEEASPDETTKIDKTNLDAAEKREAEEIEKTPAKTPPAKAISDQTKKDLASKDPDKAREASQSLPDVVSTGGG